MDDLISRQSAMNALNHEVRCGAVINQCGLEVAYEVIEALPSAQPEIIREIRKWINSSNRGNADYFIVDKIEEIINKYE